MKQLPEFFQQTYGQLQPISFINAVQERETKRNIAQRTVKKEKTLLRFFAKPFALFA
jgi:hypothetical protein